MTLAAENIALKAENARLREALVFAEHAARALHSNEAKATFIRAYTPVYGVDGHLSQALIIQALQQALAQPTPTTPETDKAQAVEAYRGGK